MSFSVEIISSRGDFISLRDSVTIDNDNSKQLNFLTLL